MRDALTPMMQQYRRLRGSIPADTLLLFRLGDFYELFFEDAKEASVLLNVALTKRNGVPMCGMPYHAAQTYIAKLIKAGRRVAICDQTSEPQPGKIVSRDITQIISAGTVSDFDLLEAKRANYLGAVYADGGRFGFAYADLTTGEFRLTELQDRRSLLDELARVSPSELLMSSEQKDQLGQIDHALEYDSYAFLPEQAIFTLCEHFKMKSLDGFGCGEMSRAVAAAGAIVHYLKHQLRRNIDHLTSLRCDAPAEYVMLDAATQTNLELVESRGTRNTTLLAVLDRTITPMGGRRLRSWILQPLRNLHELEQTPANDRGFVAGTRSACSDPRSTEINSRHRTCNVAIEPGLGKRTRPGRAEIFAPRDPEAEERTAKVARPHRFWQGGLAEPAERPARKWRAQCQSGSDRSRPASPTAK